VAETAEKKMKLRKRLTTLTALGLTSLALAGGVGAGCGKQGGGDAKGGDQNAAAGEKGKAGKPAAQEATPVTVTPASEQIVTRTVPVTGSVTALQTISLSPKQSARVISVAGREGDAVSAGQVVVQQDIADLQNSVEQAEANLQSAKAKLTQAQTNYNIQRTTSATNVQNARAAVRAAEANLALAKQPQRSEQVSQAQIAVQQAQANYDRAVADRKRYQYLVEQGAAAQATLDQYVTTEAVQKANLRSAEESLKIAQSGGRQESVLASQEAVRQAQIQLQQAQANVAQNQARLDDVRQAQASVAQYQATVDIARQALADASIRTPIDGVIATRSTEPGQQASPGTAVMTVVSLKSVYFQAQLPETQLENVREGQPVDVTVDAYPGRSFHGKVTQVYPTGSTSSRTFNVRVDVDNTSRALKPAMFARGKVIVQRRRGVVVSKDALVASNAEGTAFQVFVASGGGTTAARRAVKIGITNDTTAEILSGVREGDNVITQGQDGLKDGSPIRIESGASGQQQAAMAQ